MVIDYSLGIYAHYNGVKWEKVIKEISQDTKIVVTSSSEKIGKLCNWPLQNNTFISKNCGSKDILKKIFEESEQPAQEKIVRTSALVRQKYFGRKLP